MKKPKLVTREWLRDKIAEQPERVIARALIAIYERQTSDEQQGAYTRLRNGIGFTGGDAELGTRCAKAALAGKLEPWMVKIWSSVTRTGFPKICKYARQLNEIAEEKRKHVGSLAYGQQFHKDVLEKDAFKKSFVDVKTNGSPSVHSGWNGGMSDYDMVSPY